MSKEPDILDAAHTIRFHLRELLDDTEAEALDRKLDALLTKAESDKAAERQIENLLCGNKTVREWTHRFLNPDDVRKSYKKLPGEGGNVPGREKYICPCCNRWWFRRNVGQRIPTCCNSEALVPANGVKS
ncbi:hypothetical protein QUF72_00550 [Desulfobacterales bacterium HSG2]|nr:hypothetical protein [Desulfobacterales bacterium HSG2]MDM8548525.1 hypothetical protein [Desulfobacterales bacterium HSG2]